MTTTEQFHPLFPILDLLKSEDRGEHARERIVGACATALLEVTAAVEDGRCTAEDAGHYRAEILRLHESASR